MRILIIRLSAIGDTLQTLPLASALKTSLKNIYIGWVVEEPSADLLINNPAVDKVYIIQKSSRGNKVTALYTRIKSYFQVVQEIQKDEYDIAIDAQELFKSSFLAFLSRIKRRLGHQKSREFSHIFMNELLPASPFYDNTTSIIHRYLSYADYLGCPNTPVSFPLPPVLNANKQYVESLLTGLDPLKENIVLAPKTTWKTKLWPQQHWQEILHSIQNTFNIILIGKTEDQHYLEEITKPYTSQKTIKILAGKTSLLDLIAIFQQAKYVIATDTGPMHIAYAVNKPTVIAIFGATGEIRNGPLDQTKHKVMSHPTECSPCFSKQCPNTHNPLTCLTEISPQQVLKNLQ